MDVPVVPEIKKNRTVDQRIDLVLDLTRRLELLDELLRNARARRCATDAEVSAAEANQAELDAHDRALMFVQVAALPKSKRRGHPLREITVLVWVPSLSTGGPWVWFG